MRLSPLFYSVLLFVSVAGCFQRDVQLHPKPDGTATLEIRTAVSRAFLRYAEIHAGLPPDRIWFHEQALQHAAARFGEGVEYLDHSITEDGTSTLFHVRYRVRDVAELFLEVDVNAPFLFRPPSVSEGAPPGFRFSREGSRLRILPPDLNPPPGGPQHVRIESAQARRQREAQFNRQRANLVARGNPFNMDPRAEPEQILARLTREMDLRIRILIPGQVLSSNARFVGPAEEANLTEILLFSFSGGTFSKAEAPLRRLAEEGGGAFAWHELPDIPGVRIDTGDTILLEWSQD